MCTPGTVEQAPEEAHGRRATAAVAPCTSACAEKERGAETRRLRGDPLPFSCGAILNLPCFMEQSAPGVPPPVNDQGNQPLLYTAMADLGAILRASGSTVRDTGRSRVLKSWSLRKIPGQFTPEYLPLSRSDATARCRSRGPVLGCLGTAFGKTVDHTAPSDVSHKERRNSASFLSYHSQK